METMVCDYVMNGASSIGAIRRREEFIETVESFSCYYDIRELFKHFFRCSLVNRWDCFDFDAAFDSVMPTLNNKLTQHGLGTFDDFLEYQSELYCGYSHGNRTYGLEQYAMDGWVYVDEEELFEAIMRIHYERYREVFGGESAFMDLMELADRYEKRAGVVPIADDVALFDAIIHAEHCSGLLFGDELYPSNPDDLRVDVEVELNGDPDDDGDNTADDQSADI